MEEEGRTDHQIDAMKEEAGGVKSMQGAQPTIAGFAVEEGGHKQRNKCDLWKLGAILSR